MSIYTIYRAVCSVNGKSYIGFDSNYPQRVSNHRYNANKGVCTVFYDAIRKHGWESFEWSIVYQSRDKDHTKNIMEEFFIREYNTHVDNKGGMMQVVMGQRAHHKQWKCVRAGW